MAIENLGPELDDFCDTAAVLSQLDLVLSVDTAVAHLAGALGKPVWLMLPKSSEWRWLEGRDDSPWYPTMRLFRQSAHGDWGKVIERVRLALLAVMAGNDSQSSPAAPSKPSAPSTTVQVFGHSTLRAGLSSVTETRMGILQYLPQESPEGESLSWYGDLQHPQLDLLSALIRPGGWVLEVGAGIGAHAIALAAMVGGEGNVLLYESRPVQRQILQQNLVANRVHAPP